MHGPYALLRATAAYVVPMGDNRISMVRMSAPDETTPKRSQWGRAGWDIFWHYFTQTLWAGAPFVLFLAVLTGTVWLFRMMGAL